MGSWEYIKNDYFERMAEEKRLGIDNEKNMFQDIILGMTSSDVDAFIEEGELPSEIYNIADIDPNTGNFMSKRYPEISIGKLSDVLELQYSKSYASD